MALSCYGYDIQVSEPEQPADIPVAVKAIIKQEPRRISTRTANGTETLATLRSSTHKGFGVFACYTEMHKYNDSSVHPDFMYNEHVWWDDSRWIYTYIKYWPNGEGTVTGVTGEIPHYVSFMAYAPYSDNDGADIGANPPGYCIYSYSAQHELGNPWLTYRLIPQEFLAQQVDLLYADPLLDQYKPNDPVGDSLLFEFRHALACVGDKATILCSKSLKNRINASVEDGATVEVKLTAFTITYRLTEKGRLILWNGGNDAPANWQVIYSESAMTERTVDMLEGMTPEQKLVYDSADPDHTSLNITDRGVFYIPIEFKGYEQTAEIRITYQVWKTYNGESIMMDEEHESVTTIQMSDYPTAYTSGKELNFNIALGGMSPEIVCAIEPWRDGGYSDVTAGQGQDD